jgi:hypothetical protein
VQPESSHFFRAILDSNGLNNIPVAIAAGSSFASNSTSSTFCSWTGYQTDLNAVMNIADPSTYPDSTAVLRNILATLPSGDTAAYMSGGSAADLGDLVRSAPDGISSMTGAALFQAKVSKVYFQGVGNLIGQDSGFAASLLADSGSVPLYLFDNADFGGTPTQTGPGFGHTRLGNDPLAIVVNAGWTGEVRTGWDSLPTANFLTSLFHNTCTSGTLSITAGASDQAAAASWSWTPGAGPHWACDLSSLDNPSTQSGQVYTWFINSLANSISQGSPRGGG